MGLVVTVGSQYLGELLHGLHHLLLFLINGVAY
jgi:hypothetical protein